MIDQQDGRLAALRNRVPDIAMLALFGIAADLDRPSAGFIEVSQQPMIDTAASIAAFAD